MAKSDIRLTAKEIVANLKARNKAVVKMDDLINFIHKSVDITDVPQEEMEKAYIRQNVYPLMNALNWASVVRGHKFFMDMELCKNDAYFTQVIENSKMSVEDKRKALAKRVEFQKSAFDEIKGQMVLNFDTMTCEEDKTREEILEMLAKEA